MERLTEKDWKDKCAGYPWNVHPVKDIDDLPYYKKLAAYEDADEQGLLLRLPCKVGDNVYIIKPYGIEEASITGISEADDIDCFCFEVYIDPDCHEIIALEEFNDTWFLTREEAETKLKEMEGNND